jgi:hypothetical protein
VNHRDLTAELYRLRLSDPRHDGALRSRVILESDIATMRAKPSKKSSDAERVKDLKTALTKVKKVMKAHAKVAPHLYDHHEDYVRVDPATGKPATGRRVSTAPLPRVRPTPVADRIWGSNRRPPLASRRVTRKEIAADRRAYYGGVEKR